ncbi:MAG TPA: hypothetical protein PK299_11650, partial [Anaerolineales bacterium]|nr:hypothetical protein [Anaerolineales bacterium]
PINRRLFTRQKQQNKHCEKHSTEKSLHIRILPYNRLTFVFCNCSAWFGATNNLARMDAYQ